MSNSTFVQKVNVVTGATEWCQESEDYDYHQEVARSAYADMLHDDDRNVKYYEGLKLAIDELRRREQPVIVLDIGTGTGLLSMMAAKLGADKIYACEAFLPMAKCAANVIKHNGYSDKIKLIPKRSVEMEVGQGKDLEERANILITEVFDTELIGEGAIGTYNHAHEYLLSEGCYCIPAEATYYAQVVDCSLVPNWNQMNPIRLPNGVTINFPEDVNTCPGVSSVHDVQLSEVKLHEFASLSDPLEVFKFNWSGDKIPLKDSNRVTFLPQASHPASAVFTWWDLRMSSLAEPGLPENTITMKPVWGYGQHQAWRDHWMQSIYHIPKPLHLKTGSSYFLNSFHNEYSFWFEIRRAVPGESLPLNPRIEDQPACHCGIHVAMSRSHLGLFNDTSRHEKYVQLFTPVVDQSTMCLVLSDSSALPFILAGMGARKVFVLESNSFSERAMTKLVEATGLKQRIVIVNNLEEKVLVGERIDLVASDPCFHASVLPWHNLHYWYSLQKIKHLLSPAVKMFPGTASLKAVLVKYQDLWKIRSSVGKVCYDYFDIVDFDKLIENSSQISDFTIDAQPLWEYPSVTCSEPVTLLKFDFQNEIDQKSSIVTMESWIEGNPNGIALWMDWHHLDINGETVDISTGPIDGQSITAGEPISWNRNCKQGVYFFETKPDQRIDSVLSQVTFSPENGHIEFSFNPTFDR